jgi:hypothetical protein
MKKKKMALWLCMCQVKGQGSKKHFLCFSTFAFNVEKAWSWSGSKVKKTFSTFRLSIKKTWTVLVQRSTVQKLSEVLRVEESVSTSALVKHELKRVLKYTGKNLDPPNSSSPDRQ